MTLRDYFHHLSVSTSSSADSVGSIPSWHYTNFSGSVTIDGTTYPVSIKYDSSQTLYRIIANMQHIDRSVTFNAFTNSSTVINKTHISSS